MFKIMKIVVAEAGIEPAPLGYEPNEIPLLHSAMLAL